MSSIYMATGQMNWHRNAMEYLLSVMNHEICDITPSPPQILVKLYTNDYVPVCDSQLDDFDNADFSGYAPIVVDPGECDGVLQFGRNVAGLPTLFLDMQTFTQTAATISNLVYGLFIQSTYNGFAGAARDDAILSMRFSNGPFAMDAGGNIIKVVAQAPLDCQMAPL